MFGRRVQRRRACTDQKGEACPAVARAEDSRVPVIWEAQRLSDLEGPNVMELLTTSGEVGSRPSTDRLEFDLGRFPNRAITSPGIRMTARSSACTGCYDFRGLWGADGVAENK